MDCHDYVRCEARSCYHRDRGPRYWWRSIDGCSGKCCIECLGATDDIMEMALLNSRDETIEPTSWVDALFRASNLCR